MPLPRSPFTPLRPAPTVGQGAPKRDLERSAADYAAMDPLVAEAMADLLAVQAIARWHLEDATFWQRVKFRARLIRAARRVTPQGGSG